MQCSRFEPGDRISVGAHTQFGVFRPPTIRVFPPHSISACGFLSSFLGFIADNSNTSALGLHSTISNLPVMDPIISSQHRTLLYLPNIGPYYIFLSLGPWMIAFTTENLRCWGANLCEAHLHPNLCVIQGSCVSFRGLVSGCSSTTKFGVISA